MVGPASNPNPGWGKGQIPCFPEGTKIATPAGSRRIETLIGGDRVLAYDFDARGVVDRPVTALLEGSTHSWVDIELDTFVIRATRRHPFWIDSHGRWIDAADLEAGMTVLLLDGTTVAIRSVNVTEFDREERTYNLTVEGVGNFFAGEPGVLVHNTSLKQPGHSNYYLVDQNGNIYYEGRFGPNETAAKVRYRHGQAPRSGGPPRFSPAAGDKMVVLPGTRTYAEARRLEHERAVQNKTLRSGSNPRGNRIWPMSERKFGKYYLRNAC